MAVRVALVVLACAALAHAQHGLVWRVFNNSALAGTPVQLKTTQSFGAAYSSAGPMSGELAGSVVFPMNGTIVLDCAFVNTTVAFVWIDDHLVCQSGAYKPPVSSFDNPIFVTAGVSYPVRAQVYFTPPPSCRATTPLGCFNDSNHACAFDQAYRGPDNTPADCLTRCVAVGASIMALEDGDQCYCGNTLTACGPRMPDSACNESCTGSPSETCGAPWLLQATNYECVPSGGGAYISFEVSWSEYNQTKPASFPLAWLYTGVSAPEATRAQMQRALLNGWGSWLHDSIMSIVHLPDASTLGISLCKGGNCVSSTKIEGPAAVRVGPFAQDRSYVQFYVDGSHQGVNANISVEYSQTSTGGLALLIRPIECGGSWTDYSIVLNTRFAWLRAGETSVTSQSLAYTPHGLSPITLHTTSAGSPGLTSLTLSLGNGPVGASSSATDTVASIDATLAAALAVEMQRYANYGALAATKEAVQAAVMWNLIYTPAEQGLILPVSRSWDFTPSSVSSDWSYVIFDWDNLFASLLLGDAVPYSYSNLIQTIKSRTSAGFVPNYAAGGLKSQDRTEPPVGAMVTLQLFETHKDTWLLELLFDDLVAWNNWFLAARTCVPGSPLICLGSWNDLIAFNGGQAPPDAGNNMQDARYESGLDNSPMYDWPCFDTTSHHMALWDVGMSAMVAGEARALAQMAVILARPEQAMLAARADAIRDAIAANLWDSNLGIFVNKFTHNMTFYERISPTSFYALMAGAATDDQAQAMVENWLFSPDHFCVSPDGNFTGNTNDCFWGLPSIQASDPAFPPLGYWRGYVWGPMAQLTYWSLLQYSHLPVVQKAITALASQMNQLMLSQWNMNRHICENFSPHRVAADCTGTHFYHWGALTGFLSIEEAQRQ
eukprot:m.18530 g.18530  ORF g.18530 m.18530 type:complete len:888 (+) comp3351_c0_seq1:1594-4257(+)